MLKLLIAMAVALAMPVSQLRTVVVKLACCCPDPSQCHCPDHGAPSPPQPSMRACHRTSTTFVAPVLPAFVPAAEVAIVLPARVTLASSFEMTSPHEAPAAARPAAPS